MNQETVLNFTFTLETANLFYIRPSQLDLSLPYGRDAAEKSDGFAVGTSLTRRTISVCRTASNGNFRNTTTKAYRTSRNYPESEYYRGETMICPSCSDESSCIYRCDNCGRDLTDVNTGEWP